MVGEEGLRMMCETLKYNRSLIELSLDGGTRKETVNKTKSPKKLRQ